MVCHRYECYQLSIIGSFCSNFGRKLLPQSIKNNNRRKGEQAVNLIAVELNAMRAIIRHPKLSAFFHNNLRKLHYRGYPRCNSGGQKHNNNNNNRCITIKTTRQYPPQEVQRVGWEPEGRWFDPRLLLACGGVRGRVPERDSSPSQLLTSWLSPCVVDTAVGV